MSLPDVDAELYAFRTNLVAAASAGTGKTHRLTALYLLLVLGLTSRGRDDDEAAAPLLPDRIVATTFSRAAALEMRVRIERALVAWADGAPDAPFRAEVAARAAVVRNAPSPELLRRRAAEAKGLWHQARIDTLHGLAGRIVRGHALGLGLRPDLVMLDEVEGRALTAEVVSEALGESLDAGGDLTLGARTLLDVCRGPGGVSEAVATFFDRLDEEGVPASSLATSDHLASARRTLDELGRVAAACATLSGKKGLVAAALATSAALAGLGPAGDDGAPAGLSTLATAVEALFAVRLPKDAGGPEAALRDLRGRLLSKNATNPARAAALVAWVRAAPDMERTERAVVLLLGRLRERLDQERRARGAIGFGDLLRLARDGLARNARVADAVRAGIDVLSVDEFQDTSLVQRDLVYLLRERPDRAEQRAPGAVPGAGDLVPHGLFVVGDRKQSIYGFRGADVAVFGRMATELAGEPAARALALPLDAVEPAPTAAFAALSESRRSAPAVLSFVNAFSRLDFASVEPASDEPAMRYADAEQLVAFHAPAPGDTVTWVRDDAVPSEHPQLGLDSPALRVAFGAAHLAKRWIDEGVPLRETAILCRRRASIPLVELALAELGVPFVVAGRALFETSEVRDLSALLRLVLDPDDRHALAAVLRGPVVALSDAALLALTDEGGLSRVLTSDVRLDRARFGEESARLDAFRARYAAVRPALLRLGATDATTAVVPAFELDRLVAAQPRAAARLGNLDRVARLAASRAEPLSTFSRWLDRQILDQTDQDEAVVFAPEDDALRLTTIHGSKGLDFEAVVVVDLDAASSAQAPPLDLFREAHGPARLVMTHLADGRPLPNHLQLASAARAADRAAGERRRITYVALTRAKRRLGLVTPHAAARPHSAHKTLEAHADDALLGTFDPLPWSELVPPTRTLVAPSAPTPPPPPPRAPEARAARVVLATTPLSVFAGCARRYRLRFLLGLEEPVATGQLDLFELEPREAAPEVVAFEDESGSNPRERGRAAHRVLETWPRERFGAPTADAEVLEALVREGLDADASAALARGLAAYLSGPFAARLAAPGATVRREDELAVLIPGEPTLDLRGTVDLWVRHADGLVEVVDYKLSRPRASLEGYAFQLGAYALALARAGASRVRAGVLFLEGDGTPRYLDGSGPEGTFTAAELDDFEARLAGLAGELSSARARGSWPAQPLPSCRALGCGFVTACHRGRAPTARRR